MNYTLDLVTGPAYEPVSLADAKEWVRQDSTDDDALITALIAAARHTVEDYCGRALVTQTWDLWLDHFQGVEIPRAPLQSVTSITYTDTAGATQTLATSVYDVFTYAEAPGFVGLAYEQTWPQTRVVKDAVKIRFVAGYAETSPISIPQPLLTAIKLLVLEYYENREINIAYNRSSIVPIPNHIERLIWSYRVMGFGA